MKIHKSTTIRICWGKEPQCYMPFCSLLLYVSAVAMNHSATCRSAVNYYTYLLWQGTTVLHAVLQSTTIRIYCGNEPQCYISFCSLLLYVSAVAKKHSATCRSAVYYYTYLQWQGTTVLHAVLQSTTIRICCGKEAQCYMPFCSLLLYVSAVAMNHSATCRSAVYYYTYLLWQ
jgi:hypothetical protein